MLYSTGVQCSQQREQGPHYCYLVPVAVPSEICPVRMTDMFAVQHRLPVFTDRGSHQCKAPTAATWFPLLFPSKAWPTCACYKSTPASSGSLEGLHPPPLTPEGAGTLCCSGWAAAAAEGRLVRQGSAGCSVSCRRLPGYTGSTHTAMWIAAAANGQSQLALQCNALLSAGRLTDFRQTNCK